MNTELLAANLTAHWIQSALLAGVSLLALAVFRVREPRFQLICLQLVLAITLLLPSMQPRQPLDTPVPSAILLSSSQASDVVVANGIAEPVGLRASKTTLVRSIDPLGTVLAVLLAGFGLRLLWLAYGLASLSRFNTKARQLSTPHVAEDLEIRLGVSPRYVEQHRSGGPSTFGFFRSTIALPAGFDALELSFQRAVVCHELVHVKRRDMAIAFVEELVAAALWFHPWIWVLRSRIRVAREQVVDMKVVALLDNRVEYTRCLVEMSGHELVPHLSHVGAGMLSRRELRVRVDAMFQEVRMSRLRLLAVACALCAAVVATGWLAVCAVPLYAADLADLKVSTTDTISHATDTLSHASADVPVVPTFRSAPVNSSTAQATRLDHLDRARRLVRPADQQAPTADAPRRQTRLAFAEYPQDAFERGIKGTVTVDITVGASGDVTTAAVVSGPPELRASAFKTAMGLKFEPGPSTTAMTIGVEYLLDRQSWGVRIVDRVPPTALLGAMTQQQPSGELRVGGNIRAPRKIKNVDPVYPAIAQAAGVQGVVIIDATIDESGNVSHTRILRSIPLLDQAAVAAVSQWQYEPTLLNGVAVPVTMTVTVWFTVRTATEQVRLRIGLPHGNTQDISVAANGGLATIVAPGLGRIGFAAFPAEGSDPATVKVSIYDMNEAAPGIAPIWLRNVEVVLGGGMVQALTSPSFGIELISVAKP